MGKAFIDIIDQVCIQECINLRGGSQGKVIEVLKNKNFIQRGHTEFSIGTFEGQFILTFMSSKGVRDWLDNFKFWKEKEKLATFTAKVHHGIQDQWETIFPFVDRELKHVDKVIFSGHSLGGGLTTTAGLEYIGRKKFELRTFGSPRVVDYTTARYINKNVEVSKRFTYKRDVVTFVPPAVLNFCHTGQHIALGNMTVWEWLNIFDNIDEHEPKYYRAEIAKKLKTTD